MIMIKFFITIILLYTLFKVLYMINTVKPFRISDLRKELSKETSDMLTDEMIINMAREQIIANPLDGCSEMTPLVLNMLDRDIFVEKHTKPATLKGWLTWQMEPRAVLMFIITSIIYTLTACLMPPFEPLDIVIFLFGFAIIDIWLYRTQLTLQATVWNDEYNQRFN